MLLFVSQLVSSVFLIPAQAQQAPAKGESVKPGINDLYLSPDMKVAEWVDRFEGESREIFVARQAITFGHHPPSISPG